MAEEPLEQVEPPEHAAHARLRKGDRFRSLSAVLAAVAAVITSAAAFLKSMNHDVTESAYNTLSESIVKLSDQQRRTQEDVAMLRGYLDGVSHAPLASSAAPLVVDAGAPLVATVPTHTGRPPAVAPPAPPVKPPPFAAAISK
jgi:hypothetical protein